MLYYDTGVLLKLYTEEAASRTVREFVSKRREPLPFSLLHRAECVSALHLKTFRGECTLAQANAALADMDDDLARGFLRELPIDWERTWLACHELAARHAAATGSRTLDTLHVACARTALFREIVTTDERQAELAVLCGLKVIRPTHDTP